MNQEVLIIVACVLIIICILIYVRMQLRKNKVEKYSFFYNKIVFLNDNFELKYFIKQLEFHKKYKSKAAVQKASLSDAAIQYVSENLTYIENLIEEYKKSEKQYENYKKALKKILETEFDYSRIKFNKMLFSSPENFIELEAKMIKNIIFDNRNQLSLYVYADYTSPKGKNYWCKEFTYSFSSILNFIETVKQHEEYMKSAKYQRSILSDSLRYDVLKRDKFTCQLCGASSKKDGVKLEVDHIFPVSKGGKTEMKNLQTLCERCNRGKSDKY